MDGVRRWRGLIVFGLMVGTTAHLRAEDLQDAWSTALRVDNRLQASQRTSEAAGLEVSASRAARLPQVQTFNIESFLTNPVTLPFPTATTGTSGSNASVPSQRDFTLSLVMVSVPIYAGGRILNTIAANQAQVNAARADESRTVLDLRLDVARAYVSVLRSGRGLSLAQSSVNSLAAQVRDVDHLVREGRGLRNDLLAAQVALANARQREVQARNRLAVAWASYNRLLCRPMAIVTTLQDLAVPPLEIDPVAVDDAALHMETALTPNDEAQINALTSQAMRSRPELLGLSEQAKSYDAQAAAQLAATRPQASIMVANLYQNVRFLPSSTQENGAASVLLNWTIFDGGQARRKSQALERRGMAVVSQRNDLASNIALEVRSAWLNTQETRRRIPVARTAVAQAEENLRVARGRYLQQRGTNTEVLDAETLRVQSYDNAYNATYDAVLATFELRRAVGEL